MEKYLNFINNQWVAADDGASISVSNPATEEMVGLVSAASAGQAVHACDVAAAAQRTWRKLTSIERGHHLHNLAHALEARKVAIGQALAQESGKSLEAGNRRFRLGPAGVESVADFSKLFKGG